MDRELYSSYCGGGPLSADIIAIGSDVGNDLVAVGSGVGFASGAGGGAVGGAVGSTVLSAGTVFGAIGVSTMESVAGPVAVASAIGAVGSLLFSIVGCPSVAR